MVPGLLMVDIERTISVAIGGEERCNIVVSEVHIKRVPIFSLDIKRLSISLY